MQGGTDNPLWIVMSGTVMAYPTFLPPLSTVRHFSPDGMKARDVRLGYALAISWSFAIAVVVASDNDPTAALSAWLFISALMLILYEIALQSTAEVKHDDEN